MNMIKKKKRGVSKYQVDPQAKDKVIARAKSLFGNSKPNNPQVNQLLEAITRIEKSTNKSLLDHAVLRAFKSDTVLVNVLKKLVPDLKRTESSLTVSGGLNVSYMSDEELENATRELLQKIGNENDK